MSSNAQDEKKYLDIILWLPVGKPIFGKLQEGNLEPATPDLGGKIVSRFHWMREANQKELKVEFEAGYYTKSNQELGCRALPVEFEYEKNGLPFKGIFTIFSNGLYRWRLWEAEGTYEAVQDQSLAKHFAQHHILPLFDGKWRKYEYNSTKNLLKQYNGLLNYTQLELLFEGPFNISLVPEVFFLPQKDEKLKFKEFQLNTKLSAIINSLILYSHGHIYKSIMFDDIEYLWRDANKKTGDNIVATDPYEKFFDKEQTYTDQECVDSSVIRNMIAFRQLIVSAEHFLRHTTLIMNENLLFGLQNIQKEISEREIKDRINQDTKQLTNDFSDLAKGISNRMLESFMLLFASKLPILHNLSDIVNDLITSSDKFGLLNGISDKAVSGNELPPLIEKNHKFTCETVRTYNASKGQFDRVLNFINRATNSINNALSNEQRTNNIKLLSEIKRINEYSFEQQIEKEKFVNEVRIDDKAMLSFTGLSIVLAFILGFLQISLWETDKLNVPYQTIIIPVGYLFVIILLAFKQNRILKLIRKLAKQKEDDTLTATINTGIIQDVSAYAPIRLDAFIKNFQGYWNDEMSPVKSGRYCDIISELSKDDVKKIKFVLKKNDFDEEPIKPRFALNTEVLNYVKTGQSFLVNLRIIFYYKNDKLKLDAIKKDAKQLLDKFLPSALFISEKDKSDIILRITDNEASK